MQDFEPYGYCYGHSATRKKHVDPTAAHMNHVHIGMTKKGAAAKTSFWRAR
jgi:hypothetical protein